MADVETVDCVRNILCDNIKIPPFGQEGSKAFYSYKIDPPRKGLSFGKLDFRFPIELDALIVHDDKWLLIESKHKCSVSDIETFAKKCEFIKNYCEEGWVKKELGTPTHIE
eukprot:gene29767-39481_t